MDSTVRITGATRLDDWGVIRAQGPDAVSLLQGLLTQDIAGLGNAQAALAGLCSPKGRLLASFVVWRVATDDIALACSADLLAPTLKRLSMFVLRAKCKLSDASADWALYGLVGERAEAWLGDAAAPQPWRIGRRGDAFAIRLPDAQRARRYLLAQACGSPVPALPALSPSAWAELETLSAVARITAATVEQFVPQMVNFELVGGVNFQKGCYPGQEVVARSQYRGTIKRRAMLFESDTALQPGQEIYAADDPGQPAGMVVNAAVRAAGGVAALVEVKLDALAHGDLHATAADGPALRPLPLPYALPTADA